MKNYHSYMDRQEVSPAVHEKLLDLEPPKKRSGPWLRYGALAACAVLIIGAGAWRLTSSDPGGQTVQDALYPGVKDWYGPGEDPPDSAAAQLTPGDQPQPGENNVAGPGASDSNPQGANKDVIDQELDKKGTENAVSRGEPQDYFVEDIAGTPLWEGETFASLAEARQETAFAPYLPAAEPEGYGEFSGTLGNDTLSVFWSRGYDHIQVSVCLAGSRSYNLADPARPETYDLSLYPIPWCDSVPDELREVVSDPAFRAEDMSLSIVEARGHEHDTGGMTYSFKVLHRDGTLVSYRCDGMTAQQVWAMVEETL